MNKKNFSWLKDNLKEYNWKLAVAIMVSSILAVLSMFTALITKNIIDTLLNSEAKSKVWIPLCIGLAVILIIVALQQIQGYIATKIYGKVKKGLTSKLTSTIFKRNYQDITASHSGELVNLSINDINTITSNYVELLPAIFSIIIKTTLGITFIALIDWRLLAICCAVVLVCGVFAFLLRKKIKSMSKKLQQANGKIFATLQESYQNIEVIKTYQIDDFTAKKIDQTLDAYNDRLIKINATINAINSVIFGIFNIGLYIIIFASVIFLSATDSIILGVGSLTAMIQIIQLLKEPFMQATSIFGCYMSTLASVERIKAIENLPVDSLQKREKIDFDRIVASNLSFAYEDKMIIDNLSFEIEKGDIFAIVGESGVGKSTLLKIILGLLKADNGEIVLKKGDISTDIDKIAISYVPQKSFIVSGSILENITMGQSCDMDKVVEACKNAAIFDDIDCLKDKFNTMLGEGGQGFSVGQNQRLAIARALLWDSDVLIFDEATSALDSITEEELLKNLKKLGKTLIFVTHNAKVVEFCNKQLDLKSDL